MMSIRMKAGAKEEVEKNTSRLLPHQRESKSVLKEERSFQQSPSRMEFLSTSPRLKADFFTTMHNGDHKSKLLLIIDPE